MKGKLTAVLFIIVFILVVAVICTFLTSFDKNRAPEETPPAETQAVIAPETEPPAPTVTPVPTPTVAAPPAGQTPVPTPGGDTPAVTPAPTPEPTPEPAATPEPVPDDYPSEDLGSGTFRSNTGLLVDIRAEWSARTVSNNKAEVTVTVYLESYGIHLRQAIDAVDISLGDSYVTLDAPAVDYDGGAMRVTQLATHSFRVDLPQDSANSYHTQVVWNFGGTYGGVAIPAIECGGVISLNRR